MLPSAPWTCHMKAGVVALANEDLLTVSCSLNGMTSNAEWNSNAHKRLLGAISYANICLRCVYPFSGCWKIDKHTCEVHVADSRKSKHANLGFNFAFLAVVGVYL